MKHALTLLVGLLSLFPCLAQPQTGASTSAANATNDLPNYSRHKKNDFCTTAPTSEWMAEDEMKLLVLHRGYRIKTFKVSKTNCYEVYGFNREGRIVEAYFNPVTTRLVLQNIAQ